MSAMNGFLFFINSFFFRKTAPNKTKSNKTMEMITNTPTMISMGSNSSGRSPFLSGKYCKYKKKLIPKTTIKTIDQKPVIINLLPLAMMIQTIIHKGNIM